LALVAVIENECIRPLTGNLTTLQIPTCFKGRINTTLNFHKVLTSYRIIVVAMLGNGESSSPSNTESFPSEIFYQDNINAQYQLLTQRLGVTSLEAVIGFSMGGQQAYYWGVMHGSPETGEPFVKNIIPICTSAKTSPHNIAFLEG
jgi:homoserine acetyltransferase